MSSTIPSYFIGNSIG